MGLQLGRIGGPGHVVRAAQILGRRLVGVHHGGDLGVLGLLNALRGGRGNLTAADHANTQALSGHEFLLVTLSIGVIA
ncbi:MAG TPA: hypothetical protein VKF37_09765, partial [Chloroflexota bacterium]|nr:hypothetical protein [Chloroflexota bacterium]